MATSEPSKDLPSVIRIEIDGRKVGRLQLAHSSTAAQLRSILGPRYNLSSDVHFVDADGYCVYIEDEQSVSISDLFNEDRVVRLKTDQNKAILEAKFDSTDDKSVTNSASLGKSKTLVQQETHENIEVPEARSKVSASRNGLAYAPAPSQSTVTPLIGVRIPGSMTKHLTTGITVATQLDLSMWKQVFANCNLLCAIRMNGEKPLYAVQPVFKFKQSDDCFPLFHVNDGSYICAYMTDKRMQSSFVSSKFFDGGLDVSHPFIGIGINAEYSKKKATTNEARTVYSTCCFNHPRVTVELSSLYLEPTEQFVKAIDAVLRFTPEQQLVELNKVLSTYGHVYPRRVVLGGHLYHTEGHRVSGTVEEQKKLITAETHFKASILPGAKISVGGGDEKKSKDEMSEQDSQTTFQAVGGNTLLSRDPTIWAETVADSILWRVIEQADYQSVITLLSEHQQKAIETIVVDNANTKKKKQAEMEENTGESDDLLENVRILQGEREDH